MGWSKSSVYGTIELTAEEVSDDNSKPGTDDPSDESTAHPLSLYGTMS